MQHPAPSRVFHICSREEAQALHSPGGYRPRSLASEGFIHLSTAQQVPGVLARYFAGQSGLFLLVIDTARLGAELRYEPAVPVDGKPRRHDAVEGLFPHLYGPLHAGAVVDVKDLDTFSVSDLSAS